MTTSVPTPKRGKAKDSTFKCDTQHINNIVRELHDNGVGLGCASGQTQRITLLRALQFRGAKGLNTYEGTAAGYCRLATRVQELQEAGWIILTTLEDVIGPDGLFHPRIARYIWIGKNPTSQQLQLSLEES